MNLKFQQQKSKRLVLHLGTSMPYLHLQYGRYCPNQQNSKDCFKREQKGALKRNAQKSIDSIFFNVNAIIL